MKNEESVERKFEQAFSTASSTSPVFSYEAKQQMGKMVESIVRMNKNMCTHPGLDAANRGGFIAEEYHAGSFNLDAILKNKDTRAYTDKYSTEWGKLARRGNDNVSDVVIVKDGKEVLTVQSKYCKTAEDTSRALSEVKDGVIKYENNDTYLAPSDQVNPTDGSIGVAEHAEAAAYARARAGNVTEAKAFDHTAKKTRDVISHDGVSSSKLTKAEATKMGEGDLLKVKKVELRYQTRSTIQQVKNAATSAAAMSAVVSGSINIVRFIKKAKEGEVSLDEAVCKVISETVTSAADSALKAGAVVGVQSLMVRYGAETVVIETFARQSVKSLLKTNAVSIGVVCLVDALKDLVLLGTDKISSDQFFERQGKGILNTSAGVLGGSLGALGAQAAVSSMGLGLPMAAPLLGGLAGGLIAGLALNFAIENNIEKPYQDLLQNTENLRDAAVELQRVSRFVFGSQVLFAKIIERDQELDMLFSSQVDNIDKAGMRALSAISKI